MNRNAMRATVIPWIGAAVLAASCGRSQDPVFQVACSPSTLTASLNRATSSCQLVSMGGFDQPVALACGGLPSGARCAFAVNPLVPQEDGTISVGLEVEWDLTVPARSQPFQVVGTAGGLASSASLVLDLRPESACAGFTEQSSYDGDCRQRPPGSVCLAFLDGYRWLIQESVLGWDGVGPCRDTRIEIARGFAAEYHHASGTSLVKIVPR